MGKIIYLGFFDDERCLRKVSPACVTMMNYVIDSINDAGFNLTVVSPAIPKDDCVSCLREEIVINDQTNGIFLSSYGKGKFRYSPVRIWSRIIRKRMLLKELLELIEDGDTLIVYHSLLLMNLITQIRNKRKIRLVLQVCEIYTDAQRKVSAKKRKEEIDYIATADKYIFSTELLAQMFYDGREYVVCLGNYRNAQSSDKRQFDEKIHVVYSGTLDPRKGGAYSTVAAAEFLDERYHVHILGFGSKEEIEKVNTLIANISSKASAKVTYDGVLRGDKYSKFLQSCDIGLSTQNSVGAYNATSFPSKILSYMANGLRVVSVRIPAIETSAVNPYMYYYSGQTPQELAQTIMKVDLEDNYSPRIALKRLDDAFCSALGDLLR